MSTDSGHFPDRHEFERVIELVTREATLYLESLDERPVRSPHVTKTLEAFATPLPDVGSGAASALGELIERGRDGSVATAGPRSFHFVIGGTTPAALGADWLTTVLDQVAYAWVSSPLALQLEVVSLSWLRELFGLPQEWSGVMTTGATMANFVGLAAGREWWGEHHEHRVGRDGLAGLPPVPVFSGGYVHASAVKVLGMLGIGRSAVRKMSRDGIGRLDTGALERALRQLGGRPSIIIGNAGEVNAGDFDPIGRLADLAEEYGAWLHVDGAFGLFAGLSEKSRHLIDGVDRAHSVTVDGHKWLNVPYDCGFAFVRDREHLRRAFAYEAAYLPGPEDPLPNMGVIGPESSRRARSLSVWATLRAYGRKGYQAIVERHLGLAQHLAQLVDEAPDLERLANVPLNIVCFRYNPGTHSEGKLNELNEKLGTEILEDGRVYVGTTRYGERTALRPAIVNWRTSERDIAFFVDVVRELGARLAGEVT